MHLPSSLATFMSFIYLSKPREFKAMYSEDLKCHRLVTSEMAFESSHSKYFSRASSRFRKKYASRVIKQHQEIVPEVYANTENPANTHIWLQHQRLASTSLQEGRSTKHTADSTLKPKSNHSRGGMLTGKKKERKDWGVPSTTQST